MDEKNFDIGDRNFTFLCAKDHCKGYYKLTIRQKIYSFFKRLFDIVLSFGAVVLLAPIFLILAGVIKATSPGPVIFEQERIGRYGKVIKIFKFRTMTSKAPRSRATKDFNDADEYITGVGRFLRMTSLDEMPQLFNVIKGDMSIIGPRPLILDEVFIHKLREKNNVYMIRPGITGLAQVNGRDFLDAEDKVRFDAEYLQNMSFLLDVMIFIKSIVVVFRQENSMDASKRKGQQNDKN